ncbi:MAG: 16S rRNA (adenine(1518)-N(6)/adenine(1519)-N(6))-dimethyltransferase RsmA [Methanobacteriaceae archaeon]|nr:16S rRNA (adenine(1518)-N(6)/adenine(1519)-N(6))-dimethyltransferase RsmA [Methanobacteriaceae archaeon]
MIKEGTSISPSIKESGTVSLAQETKNILKSHGIRLNRRLGQNYLIDDFKRKKILNFANLSPEDTVLEVGSGIGTLTIPLACESGKVVAIEQDPRIFNILKERLDNLGIDNVELINKNALSIDFPYFNKIVSNLPYQISSPITFKFLEYDFDLAILMYQKEFAQRMNAHAGSKNYSRLSVMLYFKAKTKIMDYISPKSFIPPPNVESSVVKLIPLKNNAIDEFFTSVCRALFQHRRKKARKALRESFHEIKDIEKEQIKEILNELKNDLGDERVFKLTPEQILDISNFLKKSFI